MFETIKMLDENLLVLINSHHTAFLDLIFWQLSENWPTILFKFSVGIAPGEFSKS